MTGSASRTAEVAQLKLTPKTLHLAVVSFMLLVSFSLYASAKREDSAAESQSREVLGFVLGKDEISSVVTRLGGARIISSPDESIARRCYQSEGTDHTVLVFEDWSGTLSGFQIYRSPKPDSRCFGTSAVNNKLSTPSGLRLGLTRDAITQILGKPTEDKQDRLVYKSEWQRAMRPEEIARFKRAYPNEDTSALKVFVTSEIDLTIKGSKVTSIKVLFTQTT